MKIGFKTAKAESAGF